MAQAVEAARPVQRVAIPAMANRATVSSALLQRHKAAWRRLGGTRS
jgi:hypothetical protein